MVRYFTGINSTSFNKGFDFDTRIFDKSKVDNIRYPNEIYLVRNPLIFEWRDNLIFLKGKTSIRFAKQLSVSHGGIPLILECIPYIERLKRYSDEGAKSWYVQRYPKIEISEIYTTGREFSIGRTDISTILIPIRKDSILERFLIHEEPVLA